MTLRTGPRERRHPVNVGTRRAHDQPEGCVPPAARHVRRSRPLLPRRLDNLLRQAERVLLLLTVLSLSLLTDE